MGRPSEHKEIYEFVNERSVKNLIHFTRIENLSSILKNGLRSVDFLNQSKVKYKNNDELRLDNCKKASCLSIQFPNYQMFYKYRQEHPDTDWVILGIKKRVLWEKNCVFCTENAASSRVYSTPLVERKGVASLKKLYCDYPGKPTRDELGIHKSYPTHPQAEVLVLDAIEPELIWGVAFEDEFKLKKHSTLIPSTVKLCVEPRLFKYRNDYEYWRV